MITEQTKQDINKVLLDRNTGEELLGTVTNMKVLMSCVLDKLSNLELEVTRANLNEFIQNQINDTIQLMYLIESEREKNFNLIDPLLKEMGI